MDGLALSDAFISDATAYGGGGAVFQAEKAAASIRRVQVIRASSTSGLSVRWKPPQRFKNSHR